MRDAGLDKTKYVAIIGMCFLHGSFILEDTCIQIIIQSIAGVGLPLFFFLSGFFSKNGFNMWGGFIESKIKKIVIPYLVVQILSILVYELLINFQQHFSIVLVDESYAPSSIYEKCLFVFWGYRNPPLWYLKVLIIMFLLTPAFVEFIMKNKIKSIVIIIASILINVLFIKEIPYASVMYWIPEFLSGIWISIYAKDFRLNRWISLCAFIAFFVMVTVFQIQGNDKLVKYIGWLDAPFFLMGLSCFLEKIHILDKIDLEAEYLIFLLHYPLIHIISSCLGNVWTPFGTMEKVLMYIMVVVAVVILCQSLFHILKKRIKIIYRILYGKF